MTFKAQPYFVYEGLERSPDSFRLCKLHPAETDAPVQCGLVNDRISAQKGIYSALSYTWGEASESGWIQLNGKPFVVQPNLLQALKAVRRLDTEILLWVDAICINQAEVPERNHQVSIMGNIYRNAKCVLAWLGPAANDSDAYFEYLSYLEAGADMTRNVQIKLSAARAVSFLNKRSYWRRAWIKQELILAKEIAVYCGSRSSHSSSFFWEASMFTLDEVDGYEDYISSISTHRYDVLDGQRETLEELLYRYSNSECSDLRDRVFSLLAMASDCGGLESTLVDYNLSIPALFFSLIARFEPLDVASFSAILQDTLSVRRVQLMKYWDAVATDSHLMASSPMEERSFNYIRKVVSYGKSWESSFWNEASLSNPQVPEFIVQSYLATQRPEFLHQKDKLFQIEGTKLCLQFKHTLFGLHFVDVLVNKENAKDHESDILCFFDLPLTGEQKEQMWKSMQLPANMLEKDDEHLLDHGMITEWKEKTTKNYGAEVAEPDIEMICCILQQFDREYFIRSRLCLVDCRYVVSSLYGYSLLRPSDVCMRGEDFVVGDTD